MQPRVMDEAFIILTVENNIILSWEDKKCPNFISRTNQSLPFRISFILERKNEILKKISNDSQKKEAHSRYYSQLMSVSLYISPSFHPFPFFWDLQNSLEKKYDKIKRYKNFFPFFPFTGCFSTQMSCS